MEELLKALEGGDIIIVSVNSDKYRDLVKESTTKIKGKICYVTVTTPFLTLSKMLENEGVDQKDMYYIDCISGESSQTYDNASFVSSPSNLFRISLSVSKSLDAFKPKYILFDSLSTLLAYNNVATVIQFSHSIIEKLRSGYKGVFFFPNKDEDSDLFKDLSMFVDKIVKI